MYTYVTCTDHTTCITSIASHMKREILVHCQRLMNQVVKAGLSVVVWDFRS